MNSKFDQLFNKIISEQKVIKENSNQIDNKYTEQDLENQDLFNIFYDTMMTDILDICDITNWDETIYDDIAKDFITDIWAGFLEPNMSSDIIKDLFDNVVNPEDFYNGTAQQQNEWMKKAIIDGGWMKKISDLAIGYADEYEKNHKNQENNIEEIPQDFREKPTK